MLSSIRSNVKNAAKLAVYEEITIKAKNHHIPAAKRVDTALKIQRKEGKQSLIKEKMTNNCFLASSRVRISPGSRAALVCPTAYQTKIGP